MSEFLNREAILDKDDLPKESVSVPEWDGTVLVRGMTAKEKDSYEQSLLEIKMQAGKVRARPTLANSRAKMVVKCVIDDEGKRIFSDEDAAEMGEKSAAAVQRISKTIMRLSGMDEEADQGKDLSNAFGTGPTDDSPSD